MRDSNCKPPELYTTRTRGPGRSPGGGVGGAEPPPLKTTHYLYHSVVIDIPNCERTLKSSAFLL